MISHFVHDVHSKVTVASLNLELAESYDRIDNIIYIKRQRGTQRFTEFPWLDQGCQSCLTYFRTNFRRIIS